MTALAAGTSACSEKNGDPGSAGVQNELAALREEVSKLKALFKLRSSSTRKKQKRFLVQTQKLLRKSFLTLDGIARRLDPDFKDLLSKLGSPEEFQAKLQSMTAESFPKARERMEESVETFNRTSKQTIDLFEKTLGVHQATSVTDAQRRVQDLIESSLAALRTNVHSALNTNAKIIADWKDFVDRFGPATK